MNEHGSGYQCLIIICYGATLGLSNVPLSHIAPAHKAVTVTSNTHELTFRASLWSEAVAKGMIRLTATSATKPTPNHKLRRDRAFERQPFRLKPAFKGQSSRTSFVDSEALSLELAYYLC